MTAATPRPNLLEGVPPNADLYVCWSETAKGGVCAGAVTWTREPRGWCSECAKCSATGRAAVGQRVALDAAHSDMGGGA